MSDNVYGIFWGENLRPDDVEKTPLIHNFAYINDTIFIHGQEGIGKSVFLQQIIFSLTSGYPLLDTYDVSKECKVCYIQAEGDREEMWERIDNMKKVLPFKEENFYHFFVDGISLDTKDGYEYAKEELLRPEVSYDVIVIDPWYATMEGDANQNVVAKAWIRSVRKLKGMFGQCVIIVCGHPNKENFFQGREVHRRDGSVFGAREWGAFFNMVYKFKPLPKFEDKKEIKLTKGKDRSAKCVREIHMKMIEPSPLYFTTNEKHVSGSVAMVEGHIRNNTKSTRKQLIKQFGDIMSEPTIDRSTKLLRDDGLIETKRIDNEWWYVWVQNQENV